MINYSVQLRSEERGGKERGMTYGSERLLQPGQLILEDLSRQPQDELAQRNQSECIRRRLLLLFLYRWGLSVEGAHAGVERGEAVDRLDALDECVSDRVSCF